MDYKKFYEYWADLYGTGLEIANWHLNGSMKPFDNFFDAAVNESKISPKELWEAFGDVLMNPETECIESEWHGFPSGTHREELWHWFENTFNISVHDLMFPQE